MKSYREEHPPCLFVLLICLKIFLPTTPVTRLLRCKALFLLQTQHPVNIRKNPFEQASKTKKEFLFSSPLFFHTIYIYQEKTIETSTLSLGKEIQPENPDYSLHFFVASSSFYSGKIKYFSCQKKRKKNTKEVPKKPAFPETDSQTSRSYADSGQREYDALGEEIHQIQEKDLHFRKKQVGENKIGEKIGSRDMNRERILCKYEKK